MGLSGAAGSTDCGLRCRHVQVSHDCFTSWDSWSVLSELVSLNFILCYTQQSTRVPSHNHFPSLKGLQQTVYHTVLSISTDHTPAQTRYGCAQLVGQAQPVSNFLKANRKTDAHLSAIPCADLNLFGSTDGLQPVKGARSPIGMGL